MYNTFAANLFASKLIAFILRTLWLVSSSLTILAFEPPKPYLISRPVYVLKWDASIIKRAPKKNTSKRNSTLSFLPDTLKKHDDYIDISQIISSLKTYK